MRGTARAEALKKLRTMTAVDCILLTIFGEDSFHLRVPVNGWTLPRDEAFSSMEGLVLGSAFLGLCSQYNMIYVCCGESEGLSFRILTVPDFPLHLLPLSFALRLLIKDASTTPRQSFGYISVLLIKQDPVSLRACLAHRQKGPSNTWQVLPSWKHNDDRVAANLQHMYVCSRDF